MKTKDSADSARTNVLVHSFVVLKKRIVAARPKILVYFFV